jgi:PKD repeat protein
MRNAKRIIKTLILSTMTLLIIWAFACSNSYAPQTTTVEVTVASDRALYYIREPATISGSILENGQPATGYLVAIQVDNRNGYPLLFRTIQIGNAVPDNRVQVTNISLTDLSLVGTDAVAVNTQFNLNVTVHNNMGSQYPVVVSATIFDGNLIPIFSQYMSFPIDPLETRGIVWLSYVPEWTYCGRAFVAVDCYSDLPENGGTPYMCEVQYPFYVTRSSELVRTNSMIPPANTSSPGLYSINFRMPPDTFTLPGNYVTSIVAQSASNPLIRRMATASFSLADYPAPPQAAFTYVPLKVYEGLVVTFDGSSSSAEGYNDSITQYEWTINDPYNQTQIVSGVSSTSHAFSHAGTYTVQLNVTDTQGLWSTTSKPISVLPEFGPTANFTWAPTSLGYNQTATFNASQSQPGWSKQLGGYASIANYTWNFNDGTLLQTTANTTIQHKFTQPGNYSVQLAIMDVVGRTSSVSEIVQVMNRTNPYDIDGNGKVDMKDVAIVAKAFGSTPGSPSWDPRADLDGNGKVDMKDIGAVAKAYGT